MHRTHQIYKMDANSVSLTGGMKHFWFTFHIIITYMLRVVVYYEST